MTYLHLLRKRGYPETQGIYTASIYATMRDRQGRVPEERTLRQSIALLKTSAKLLLGGLLLCAGMAWAQPAASGPRAEALGSANLRAAATIESPIVGEIRVGSNYPVIGRSEFYPWLLLGEPGSLLPKGWVYETLVVLDGSLQRVPLSLAVVNESPPTALPAAEIAEPGASTTPAPTASAWTVSGVVRGEVNIRHGPGIDYPRAGVAAAGDRFEISGYHTQFPWLRIVYPASANGQAWIARDLLEVNGDIFSAAPVSQARFALPPATATPQVVRAVGIGGNVPAPLEPAFAALSEDLWLLLLEAGFDPQTSRFGALYVQDLQTRQAFTFGDDIAFSGTSLSKIAILARLYETLNAPPSLAMATDMLNTMICSENAATNRLLSAVGAGNVWLGAQSVSDFLARQGWERSFLSAPFTTIGTPEPPPFPISAPQTSADQLKAQPDLFNQLTAAEAGALLGAIYNCAYGSSHPLGAGLEGRECRQMLHVMSNNTVDALLKSGVPADTRVAHKHGWIPDTHGNSALFFTPGGDYVIAMLLFQPDWLDFQESLPLFAEVSRRVYNYFNPQQPFFEEREWTIPDVNSCNFFGDALAVDIMQWQWDK